MSVVANPKDLLSHYSADSDDADCSTRPDSGQSSCKRRHCRLYALTLCPVIDRWVCLCSIGQDAQCATTAGQLMQHLADAAGMISTYSVMLLSKTLLNSISCVPFTGSWAGVVCGSSLHNKIVQLECSASSFNRQHMSCTGMWYTCVNKYQINCHT